MLAEFFLGQIKSDFRKGLAKIASRENVEVENIQIQIKLSEAEQGLDYAIFRKWQCAYPKSSFKEIMGIKIDVLQKEATISPVIYEIIVRKIGEYNVEPKLFSTFLFERNKELCVAFHNGNDYLKICPIADLFET